MNLHDAKRRLQQHLSDGMVVIVGSGLSCAEGLPGMGDLARHLADHMPGLLRDEDFGRWELTARMINEQGLEAALLAIEPTAAMESSIVALTTDLIYQRELAVVSEVLQGNRQLRLSRLIPQLVKPTSGLPIITTNYDRLVELALEEAGIGVDTMFVGRMAGKLDERESKLSFCRGLTTKPRISLTYGSRALVCKPHGSLDWYLRGDSPISYGGQLSGVTNRLVITPGRNKFRNGYDSPFDLHRSRANEAIDRASRFLIIGYGFNDDHLETHLGPAIRRGKPTLMITRDLTRTAAELVLGLTSVMAVSAGTMPDGSTATKIHLDREEHLFPDINLWDLSSFVSGVLEP